MSKVDELIKAKSQSSKEFRQTYEEEEMKLAMADLVYDLRQQTGLNQTAFAKKVQKSRSTIARIENGTMEPSIRLLSDIAVKLGKKMEIKIVEDEKKLVEK